MSDPTFYYRIGAGLLVFAVLGGVDWYKHPHNPRRFREYAFLFGVTGLVMLYAIVHDLISYTVSPAYYVVGKGLSGAVDSFDPEVTHLALTAGWSGGLVAAALLLFMNSLGKKRAPLPLKDLLKLIWIPWSASILAEILGGFIGGILPALFQEDTRWMQLYDVCGRNFFLVWGMHFGLYLGAIAGVVIASRIIWKRRSASIATDSSVQETL